MARRHGTSKETTMFAGQHREGGTVPPRRSKRRGWPVRPARHPEVVLVESVSSHGSHSGHEGGQATGDLLDASSRAAFHSVSVGIPSPSRPVLEAEATLEAESGFRPVVVRALGATMTAARSPTKTTRSGPRLSRLPQRVESGGGKPRREPLQGPSTGLLTGESVLWPKPSRRGVRMRSEL